MLTELGIEKGGQTRSAPEIGEFVVWPETTAIENIESPVAVIGIDDIDSKEISEGEDYIAEYFDAIDMEYREQHVIEGLDDKFAGYRIADFYLPKYQVMVEFAGRWNRSEDERIRYRHKKEVYKANGILCVCGYTRIILACSIIFFIRDSNQFLVITNLKKD